MAPLTRSRSIQPDSIAGELGMGYGPGSLSDGYAVNVIGVKFACAIATTLYGIPYVGLLPKSGCRCVEPLGFISAMYCCECALTA